MVGDGDALHPSPRCGSVTALTTTIPLPLQGKPAGKNFKRLWALRNGQTPPPLHTGEPLTPPQKRRRTLGPYVPYAHRPCCLHKGTGHTNGVCIDQMEQARVAREKQEEEHARDTLTAEVGPPPNDGRPSSTLNAENTDDLTHRLTEAQGHVRLESSPPTSPLRNAAGPSAEPSRGRWRLRSEIHTTEDTSPPPSTDLRTTHDNPLASVCSLTSGSPLVRIAAWQTRYEARRALKAAKGVTRSMPRQLTTATTSKGSPSTSRAASRDPPLTQPPATTTPPSAGNRPGRYHRRRLQEHRTESHLAAYQGFAHNVRHHMDRAHVAVWQVTSALQEAEDELDALPPPDGSTTP